MSARVYYIEASKRKIFECCRCRGESGLALTILPQLGVGLQVDWEWEKPVVSN